MQAILPSVEDLDNKISRNEIYEEEYLQGDIAVNMHVVVVEYEATVTKLNFKFSTAMIT